MSEIEIEKGAHKAICRIKTGEWENVHRYVEYAQENDFELNETEG